VVGPANRDDEFVAYSSSECARLREGEVMRIRRYAAVGHLTFLALVLRARRPGGGPDGAIHRGLAEQERRNPRIRRMSSVIND
jgi:hypothetical protein